MKTLLLLLTAAGLTGCAVYPAPAYEPYGGVAAPPYVVEQPVYIYGGGGGYSRPYPYGYNRPPPPPPVIIRPHRPPPPVVVVPNRPFHPGAHQPRPGRGNGDRDRDGIPNRRDFDGVRPPTERDRDGDGVPNRLDRQPNNPTQR